MLQSNSTRKPGNQALLEYVTKQKWGAVLKAARLNLICLQMLKMTSSITSVERTTKKVTSLIKRYLSRGENRDSRKKAKIGDQTNSFVRDSATRLQRLLGLLLVTASTQENTTDVYRTVPPNYKGILPSLRLYGK